LISCILWTAGHFVTETRFIAEKAQGFQSVILTAFTWLIPNFQLFNARDAAGAALVLPPSAFLAAAAWVCASYLGAVFLIKGKEF
jgi:hypothetical protein